MTSGLCTYTDLQTVLSVEDLHDILEIAEVDSHNKALIRKAQER